MAAAAAIDAMAQRGELFTRGGMDAPDTRGSSMMQKHTERLQQEKEAAALTAVRAQIPSLGPAVAALALAECEWDVEQAAFLLHRFQNARAEQLAALQAKRPAAAEGAAGSASGSGSESGSGNDEDNRSRRRHRSSKGKKDSSKSRKKRKHKNERHSMDDSKRSKRHKVDKKPRKAEPAVEGVVTEQYGAHGIIRETDIYTKSAEFQLWAMEVKKLDVENMPKQEEKELFTDYMEDYNTATLAHRKYYDLESYEREKAMKAARKGLLHVPTEKTVFDDEEQKRREVAAQRAAEDAERLQLAYNQIKGEKNLAEGMREQELLRMQMQMAYRTGDHEMAAKLQERLKPDEQKEAERIAAGGMVRRT